MKWGGGCLKVRQTSGKLPALVPALACRMSQGQRAQHEREHWFQEKGRVHNAPMHKVGWASRQVQTPGG